jgi:nucleoside-diphosphate-sugar epimerase
VKILLTGPTGFIGSAFLRTALRQGHDIAALVRPEKWAAAGANSDARLTWLPGTLADAPWPEIRKYQPDICLHTAWIATPGVYLASPENERYVDWSLDFIRRLSDIGVRRILALGTCLEYQGGDQVLSEGRTPLQPLSLYARCKNDLRIALESEAAARGFALCWGRVFYPYGVGEHPLRLCSSLIRSLDREEKILLKTPGSVKDYIYIDDLAAALLAVAESQFCGAINLGTGTGVAVGEVAETIARLMGKAGGVESPTSTSIAAENPVVADATKLRGLGWRPQHTLSAGLEKMIIAARTVAPVK